MPRGHGHRDPTSLMPQSVNVAKPPNKEKSYKKYLESQCSEQWRKHLELTLSDPPGRVRAYVHWHLHNKHTRSKYKPAPYLTHQSCPYQLELLRIRPQNTIHIKPSHLHFRLQKPSNRLQGRGVPALSSHRHTSTWRRNPYHMLLPSHKGGTRTIR